jgi:hypothetical protein
MLRKKMFFYKRLRAAALVLLPLAAAAQRDQTTNRPADPTMPAASVPAMPYQSSFKEYRGMTEETDTPDAVWVAANQEVAGQNGDAAHAGRTHAGHATETGQPTQSGGARQPAAPAADPHAGHNMTHGMQHGKGH